MLPVLVLVPELHRHWLPPAIKPPPPPDPSLTHPLQTPQLGLLLLTPPLARHILLVPVGADGGGRQRAQLSA
jgi:hypothetical protein